MNKFRKRCIEKIAQTATVAPNAEVKAAVPEVSVSGAPPSLTVMFPILNTGYNATIVNQIVQLCNYMNTLLFYTSNGQYNLLQIYNTAASISTGNIVN